MTLKRGLVLEGGGAKGAWQFGALRALAERGVRFDAVSGTSVGALNGAIWSANRIDFGEKMWSEMSLSRVFLRRPWLVPLLVIGGFAQLYLAFLSDFFPRHQPLPKLLQWLFSALTAIPWFLLVVAPMTLSVWNDDDWTGWMLLALPIFTGCALFFDRTYLRLYFLATFGVLFAIMIAIELFYGPDGFGPFGYRSWLFWVATAPQWIAGLALATRFVNLSYFSPEPLTKTIDVVLKSGLNVPLFVTSAREVREYFDPDNVYFLSEADSFTSDPFPLSTMLAEYNRIDSLPPDAAREALLASSALPFGIAPARRDSGGRRVVDGGMVDNIPWFPLIEMFACDEIIIVGCNPLPAWSDQISREIWQLKDRLSRLIEADVRLDRVLSPRRIHNNPPTEFPYHLPTHWPAKVTVIAPATSLGTFTTATMNFSKKSTIEWIKAGYDTAKDVAL
jgi:predicted acylesterase/phospholipase RssA